MEHRRRRRRGSGDATGARARVESDPARHAADPADRNARGHDRTPTNVGASEQPVILPVFAAGVGAFLLAADAADRDAAGDLAYPILDQRPDMSAWAAHRQPLRSRPRPIRDVFEQSAAQPATAQRELLHTVESDAARFSDARFDRCVQALNAGLEERLDHQLLDRRRGPACAVRTWPNHAAAAVTGFADYVSQFGHARVDGRYAAALADVRTRHGERDVRARGQSVPQHDRRLQRARCARRSLTGGVRVIRITSPDVASKQNALDPLGSHDRAVVQTGLGFGVTILVSEAETALAKKGEIRDHGDPAVRDQDPAAGFVLQAGSSSTRRR